MDQQVRHVRSGVANERDSQASRTRKQNAPPSLTNVCQRVPPVPWIRVGTYVVRTVTVKYLDEQIIVDLLCKGSMLCSKSCGFVPASQKEKFWANEGQNRPPMLKRPSTNLGGTDRKATVRGHGRD